MVSPPGGHARAHEAEPNPVRPHAGSFSTRREQLPLCRARSATPTGMQQASRRPRRGRLQAARLAATAAHRPRSTSSGIDLLEPRRAPTWLAQSSVAHAARRRPRLGGSPEAPRLEPARRPTTRAKAKARPTGSDRLNRATAGRT